MRAKVSENELVRVSQPGILTISHVLNGKAAHPLTTYHGQQINQPAEPWTINRIMINQLAAPRTLLVFAYSVISYISL